MAAVRGVVIEGLDELSETLLDITPREANALLKKVCLGIAEGVADKIRERAPVRTGNLRAAIVAVQGKQKRNFPSAEVRITHGSKALEHDAFYWYFVEFGTVKMRAEPFIVPAVEQARPGVAQAFREGVGTKLEETLAKKAKKRR